MRLPRLRMTTRRWMVVVAVLAVGCSAVLHSIQERRRERFVRIADPHLSVVLMPTGFHYRERRSAKRLDRHRKMVEKYLRAARYPWLLVGPNPPGGRAANGTSPAASRPLAKSEGKGRRDWPFQAGHRT